MNIFSAWKKDQESEQKSPAKIYLVKHLDKSQEYKCRICMDFGDENSQVAAPCDCGGSIKYIHVICLKEWIKEKRSINCELCKTCYTGYWKSWAIENDIIKNKKTGIPRAKFFDYSFRIVASLYGQFFFVFTQIILSDGNIGIKPNGIHGYKYFYIWYMFFGVLISFLSIVHAYHNAKSLRSTVESRVRDLFPHSSNIGYHNYLGLPVKNTVK